MTFEIEILHLPTSQACLYHCIILNYRLGYVECRSLLETARGWVASCNRWYWIIDWVVVVVHTCELNVWVIIGWNYWWLSSRRKLSIVVSVVGIIWCELTRYVLNVLFLWWLSLDALCGVFLTLNFDFFNAILTHDCCLCLQSSILIRMSRVVNPVSTKKKQQ